MLRILCCALVVSLCFGDGSTQAQTAKIQAEVDKKLEQQRTEQKAALQQLIAEALKNNPDIRVGESKVRDAEAELQRTRMKVLSEVTVMHAETQAAQAAADEKVRSYERAKKVGKSISAEELAEAENKSLKSKANLAVMMAKLAYLVGKASVQDAHTQLLDDIAKRFAQQEITIEYRLAREAVAKQAEKMAQKAGKTVTDEEFLRRAMLDLTGRLPTPEETKDFLKDPAKDRREKWVEKLLKSRSLEAWLGMYADEAQRVGLRERFSGMHVPPATPLDSPMLDKLRKALDTPVQISQLVETPHRILLFAGDKLGVNLVDRAKALKKEPVEIEFREPIALGAFLQYLEDELHIVFVLRDYGVVAVDADFPLARLPPGAMTVSEFWKRQKAAEKSAKSTK